MSRKINWGIIGAGAIAQAFARGAAKSRTANLLAVASREQAKAEKFGTEYNIPKRYGSYEQLIADKEVQAIYICTPHPMHAEWAIKAMEAGKHVLCEKPMCVNYWDATAMVEAARKNGVTLMEAFMYRCNPQTQKLVELIKSKAIGEVRSITAAFGWAGTINLNSRIYNEDLAGGGIADVGCYATSMARLVAGAALGKDFANPLEVKAVGVLHANVDIHASAVLKFAGDILAFVSTATTVALENTVKIIGTAGSIFLPNPWVADRVNPPVSKIVITPSGKPAEEIEFKPEGTSFQFEIDVFGDAVLAGKQEASAPAMTWDDTLGNLQTLDRWRESIGLQYAIEKPEKYRKTTVSGKPLAVNANHNMQYGSIPHLDRKVSRLIYGCDNQNSLAQMAVMADDCYSRGINTFDTAFVYGGGRQEMLLGQWIKHRGVRNDVNVIVKGGHTPHCNPPAIRQELKTSLDRLQIDCADIYIMHRDNLDVPVGEFIGVLNEQKKAGRIKAFGGSNWSIARWVEANDYARKNGLQPFSLLNNNFSLARMMHPIWNGCITASDPESIAFLNKNKAVNLSWSSQARGFFLPGRAAPDKLDDKELVKTWYSDDNFKRLARTNEFAAKRKVEPITVALAYVLCQEFPSFALIGPRNLWETRTSLPAMDLKLSTAEVKWLNLESDSL